MVLTERDRRLIAQVNDFGVLTRDQLRQLCAFGSITRVNAILLRLVRAEYLRRRWRPTLTGSRYAVYLMGPRGHELLTGESLARRSSWGVRSDLFIEHQLLINDVRLAYQCASALGVLLTRWRSEVELRTAHLPIVPDAYLEWTFRQGGFSAFLEADLSTETRARWVGKIRGYLSLTVGERFHQEFGRRFFRVLIVVPNPQRVNALRQTISQYTDRVFWLTTREALVTQGPTAAIWQRPTGTTLHSLITS
jgi:Replication-relaxation